MKRKKHTNTFKVEIPELTTFLSNGVFNQEVTNKFLDVLYAKYRFNRYVRLKIKDTFIKLSIDYNETHLFFTHIINNDGYSFQFLIKTLKFNDALTNQNKLKYRKLLLNKIISKVKVQVVKKSFKEIYEKMGVSNLHHKGIFKIYNIVKNYTEELDNIEFNKVIEHIARIKLNILIKLTDKEMKYKDYIIRKNSVLSLMNHKEQPFIETCGKAFDKIKYARNLKKIILINSK